MSIWTALLTTPTEKKVVICSDSNLAIKSIREGLACNINNKIRKKKNPVMIINIVDVIKKKKLVVEFRKVKSYNKEKWNEYADKLAKRGLHDTKEIDCKEIYSTEVDYQIS